MKSRRFPLAFFGIALLSISCAVEEQSTEPETQFRVIDYVLLESLAEGEQLIVDVSAPDTAWVFDQTSGAIDYDRIQIICPNQQQMSMNEWFANEGRRPAEDSKGRFVLVNDPQDFETLDDDQVEQMRDAGEEKWGFRIEEINVDGHAYLVCESDGMFSCNDGMDWKDL